MNDAMNFEEAFQVKDITSAKMKDQIQEWSDLYYADNTPEDENPSQRLPVAVVGKITKAVFSEYSLTLNKNIKADGFYDNFIKAIGKQRKKGVQQALIGGSCLLKPVITRDKMVIRVIPRTNFIPLGRDLEDNLTDLGTSESIEFRGKYYTVLERRYVTEYHKLAIETRLYESTSRDNLGKPVSLDTIPQTADLVPYLELNIDNIGMTEVRCPSENCVDGTDDAVSVYAAAVLKIHQINQNEYQIDGEFNRGQSRIIVSNDMLKSKTNGAKALVDDLFVGVDEDPENVGINIFSPAFRQASYFERKKEYLRDIESLISLKRGTISEVESEERTATEITSSAGEYNLTIIDFQEMWADAVKDCAAICVQLAKIYNYANVSDFKDDNLVIDWGNGILYDRNATWAELMTMVQSGMLKPEIAVGWYFNVPTESEEDLKGIREKYMPEIQILLEGTGE